MTTFNALTETDLIERLRKVQTHPFNAHRDVMTFAIGFAKSRADLLAKVEMQERQAGIVAAEKPIVIGGYTLDPAKIAAAKASHEAVKALFKWL
jgi:hypothetical protein